MFLTIKLSWPSKASLPSTASCVLLGLSWCFLMQSTIRATVTGCVCVLEGENQKLASYKPLADANEGRAGRLVRLTQSLTHTLSLALSLSHTHTQIQSPTSGLRTVSAKYLTEQTAYWGLRYSQSLTRSGAENQVCSESGTKGKIRG